MGQNPLLGELHRVLRTRLVDGRQPTGTHRFRDGRGRGGAEAPRGVVVFEKEA